MKDSYGRTIDYMRISITDRCNLRCRYCMPEDVKPVAHEDILTYEEILRLCRVMSGVGIRKIKVTGGEPLVRLGCMDLLRQMKEIPGIDCVTITTNGVELDKYLSDMIDIGVDGLNISLDTLRRDRYKTITGRDKFDEVWSSVLKAVSSGLKVKLNCVPIKDFNDDEWKDFAELTVRYPVDIRFIEMMPIGCGRDFVPVSGSDILAHLQAHFRPLEEVAEKRGNGPARYWRGEGMQGAVGFIEAVNHKFCDTCNRVRITSEGMLKLCLYYNTGVDLRGPLRSGIKDQELLQIIEDGIARKPMEHRFYCKEENAEMKQMSQIGG